MTNATNGSDDWLDIRQKKVGMGNSLLTRKLMASRAGRIRGQIAGWKKDVAMATPPFTQCQHLIKKFGGIIPFAVAVGVHPSEIIQFWLASPYAKKNGTGGKLLLRNTPTGGFVPSAYLPTLIVAARYFGILLTPQDLYPDFLSDKPAHLKDMERWIRTIKKSDKMQEFEHVLASLASTPV